MFCTKENGRKKTGLSLIVLVITVIVVIILAMAVLLTMTENNPIENAKKAAFQSDLKNMQEDLNMYIFSKVSDSLGSYKNSLLNANKNILIENAEEIEGKNIQDVISSLSNKYIDKLEIKNGNLVYVGNDEKEKEWASEVLYTTNNVEVVSDQTDIVSSNNGSLKNSIVNISIGGKSIQNGIPTPNEPVDIENVGDNFDNVYKISLKFYNNVVDQDYIWNFTNWVQDSNLNMQQHHYGVKLKLKPNTTYIVEKYDNSNVKTNFGIWLLNDDGNAGPRIGLNNVKQAEFTTSKLGEVYLASWFAMGQKQIDEFKDICKYINIYEKNNFEEYAILLDEPLYGVDDVNDQLYIDILNSKSKLIKKNKDKKFNYKSDYQWYYNVVNYASSVDNAIKYTGISNRFINPKKIASGVGEYSINHTDNDKCQIVFNYDGKGSNIDEWVELLTKWNDSGKPLEVVYNLNTPSTLDITDNINFSTLNNLFGKYNTMNINTSISPSNITYQSLL